MKRNFWKHLAAILLAGALALPASAQQNNEVRYNNGKILLEQQRFDQAMAELMPLTDAGNPYAPEASYFYALAALNASKLVDANLMLQQLKEQHPQWQGMPEAQYLLANVLFERNNYEQALAELRLIKSSALRSDADGLKRYYLNRLNDRTTFEKLLQLNPEDKIVAQAFADKLVNGWYRPQDKTILENLVARHNLDRNRYLRTSNRNGQGIRIAALLPFQLNQDPNQSARKNQFVNDLYAGMKLAQDSLAQLGIQVNLYSYDVGTDTATARKTLALPEMRQMDLVIGPIYKSAAPLAARFATQHNIPVINPLTQDLEVAQNSQQVYLFESSIATQARQAASYAYNNFSPKTVTILYEGASSDTTFARYYRQHFISLGGKVKAYKKINSAQASATASAFTSLDLTNIGHLAVFSDKMTAAVNAMSLLSGRPERLPLITYDKWLEINQISLRQLDNQEIYFISPKYVNRMSPATNWFRKRYTAKYNLPPSAYAYAGFEMLFYYSNLLQQYGSNLSQALVASGVKPGVLYQGIGYTNGTASTEPKKDNQYVPITKLENLQLIVVNPTFY
ncbi:ABC transporter substrate-binding protein [Pontibacter sp. SGAir0037]|uniref:ABC transporter substrate-binding protein n=1 Tax=Pontibacter sp. SGAir0037 TaxID=2571030 RepID=UPI0010CD1F98|nr:ABC transporter substrate-binding protein [Pontibacter sp. SGAir0037]QCR25043.1 hypothetical protein C1N53_12070 [Pontibacter sp. SGAir0037]